jgi:serine/threonine protein kinase
MDKPNDLSLLEKTTEDASVDFSTRVERDQLIGSMLDRRYLVKRKLGHGGFGAVYLASDEKMMSRPVVVKALLDEKISSEWSVRKFKQEMEALARVDHPSIVGIFDSGQLDNGQPFLVMQYVDGASLRELIRPEGMNFSQAANIIRQIGRALSAAHHRGILHRDLKPENIMVQSLSDGEEQVKIIDFGIAKIKDSVVSFSTVGEQFAGTALYMSPEQLKTEPLTPASDLYCFAVIAYEMLTGRRPNNPNSAFQLLEMQREPLRIKPRDLRPNLSTAAEAILIKALSFDPKDRYQKAREFGDALATALLGEIDDPAEVTVLQTPQAAPDAPTLETNPATVSQISASASQPRSKTKAAIAAAAFAFILLLAGAVVVALKLKTAATAPPKVESTAAAGVEQSLTYWLTVQKMRNQKAEGEPIESAGDNIFGNGWRFRFNVRPAQAGAMYLLNVGPTKKNANEYNILFPVMRDNKLDAAVAANQIAQTDWLRFVEQTGVEKLWLIWTAKPVTALDTIFADAARNDGVVTNPEHLAHLQTLLKKYDDAPPESRTDKASKLTLVKGHGEVLVNLIQLSHEAY